MRVQPYWRHDADAHPSDTLVYRQSDVIVDEKHTTVPRPQCASFAVPDGVDKEQLMNEKLAEMRSTDSDDANNLRSRRDASQENGGSTKLKPYVICVACLQNR